MKTEPVLTAGAITGVLMAGLFMAVSLGWLHLNETQLGSVETFVGALLALLLPVLISLWPRSQVTPVVKLTTGATVETATGETGVIIPAAQAQMLGVAPLDGPK